jgi:hypothetical protein
MPYTANEYLIVVTGRLQGPEVWSNTWAVLDVGAATPTSSAVAQVRGFYNDIIGEFSNEWHADAASVKQLSTGISSPATWETFAGSDAGDDLPSECAIRVSLDDQQGHRGGPFLGGFTTNALASDGRVAAATVTVIAGALDALASGLVSNGYQLRINRPTVSQTVVALRGRVGTVYDVIRKRRNNIAESYTSVDLT